MAGPSAPRLDLLSHDGLGLLASTNSEGGHVFSKFMSDARPIVERFIEPQLISATIFGSNVFGDAILEVQNFLVPPRSSVLIRTLKVRYPRGYGSNRHSDINTFFLAMKLPKEFGVFSGKVGNEPGGSLGAFPLMGTVVRQGCFDFKDNASKTSVLGIVLVDNGLVEYGLIAVLSGRDLPVYLCLSLSAIS